MTTRGSRDSGMDRGARKPTGMVSSSAIPRQPSCGGQQPSGSKTLREGPSAPRQSSAGKVTEEARVKVEKVLERVYDQRQLRAAWHQVRKNAGAAGVDRMTVEEFGRREEELLEQIHQKLKAGAYRFKPARRVLIPKPGSTKKRKLGIPVVMDRIVSQSLHVTLEGIFGPDFTASNFGYREGVSQQRAVGQMREAIGEGREWGVAIDLESFFDEIPHGLILKLIRRKIRDERVVTLIARALKAGVMIDGKLEKTEKGVPQGSPVSPTLSNIVLNELDQELEKRGHRYCRWADDAVILVKSERAAQRVMENTTTFLEQELGLPVNREKSLVTKANKIEFLGCQVQGGKIRVGMKARERFKNRVRELTPRKQPPHDVQGHRAAERIPRRLGELPSTSGIEGNLRTAGHLRPQPAALDAAEEMEEAEEVPEDYDTKGVQSGAGPEDLGEDEPVEVSRPTRGQSRTRLEVVPEREVGAPGRPHPAES